MPYTITDPMQITQIISDYNNAPGAKGWNSGYKPVDTARVLSCTAPWRLLSKSRP
jgi:hypothetical protein